MKFAKHWAKEDVSVTTPSGRTYDLAGWGASNVSEDDARAKARERASWITNLVQRDDHLREYDYSIEYIREEVEEELRNDAGDLIAVVSRNGYGALVLNTDRVLFADIDVPPPGAFAKIRALFGKPPKDKDFYLERVREFHRTHSDLAVTVYETFAGLRVVITNREYQPDGEDTRQIFDALHTDKLYRRLCLAQDSFRARLTPKPWRVKMQRPPNRYPRQTEDAAIEFQRWLTKYVDRSTDKAVVRKMGSFGPEAAMPPDIAAIMRLHDDYACADGAPLA